MGEREIVSIESDYQNCSLNSKNEFGSINCKIREHETKEKDWRLHETAEEFYRWFDLFNERFFEFKLETAVISFESTRRDVMGHYVIERNAIGVKDNININSKYIDGKKWENLDTLLHEMTHQFQRRLGKKKDRAQRKGNYHDKEFKQMMASFGLICDSRGCHIEPPKDPFVSFLREHGVEVDIENGTKTVLESKNSEQWPDTTKLKKFSCECDPVINVRVADKRFSGKCNHCGKDFKPTQARNN